MSFSRALLPSGGQALLLLPESQAESAGSWVLLLVASRRWNQLATEGFHWCQYSLLSGTSDQWEGVLGEEGQNYATASSSFSLWLLPCTNELSSYCLGLLADTFCSHCFFFHPGLYLPLPSFNQCWF